MIQRAPRPNSGFLIISNAVARDNRLSYRASGLLADVLSRPDNWTISAARLASARPGGEGERAVRTALKELEKAGYLKRQRIRDERGKFVWAQTIYDIPQTAEQLSADVSPVRTMRQESTCGEPPGGNRRSIEEPSRRTEEEDVSEMGGITAARSAPVGDGENSPDEDEADETPADWRTEDRYLFFGHVGEIIESNGSRYTKGRFNAEQFYRLFRKQEKTIKWPGRYLEHLSEVNPDYGVDDWLLNLGLERVNT